MSSSSTTKKNTPIYKTPYVINNLTALKTLNNLQSVNSDNFTRPNFVKVGLPRSFP